MMWQLTNLLVKSLSWQLNKGLPLGNKRVPFGRHHGETFPNGTLDIPTPPKITVDAIKHIFLAEEWNSFPLNVELRM